MVKINKIHKKHLIIIIYMLSIEWCIDVSLAQITDGNTKSLIVNLMIFLFLFV